MDEDLIRQARARVQENFDLNKAEVGDKCDGALILALAAEVKSLQATNDTMVRIANIRAEERDEIIDYISTSLGTDYHGDEHWVVFNAREKFRSNQ